jgi:aminoglycoside phosphotransferase (APT) family kinase protein
MTEPEGIDAPKISAWFADNIPGVGGTLSFRLIAGGRSNLTYEVTDGAGHRWVLRRPPTGHVLPTAHDMAREFRIISAVGPAGIPVAPPLGLCQDETVNGAPFYVMGFVDGLILRHASEVEAGLDITARRRASEALVDRLADLHALDPNGVGLGDLSRHEGYIARQLRRWNAQYLACRDDFGGPTVPAVEAAYTSLSRRVPDQQGTAIVHGDYRLDNTVLDANGRVLAVLDWELCTLGDPLADVGQLLAYWAEPGDERGALDAAPTLAQGFFTREEVVGRYGRRSERDLSRLDFYVAFNYWKLACIIEGVYTRYVAGVMGDDSADVSWMRQSLDWLAERANQAANALSA